MAGHRRVLPFFAIIIVINSFCNVYIRTVNGDDVPFNNENARALDGVNPKFRQQREPVGNAAEGIVHQNNPNVNPVKLNVNKVGLNPAGAGQPLNPDANNGIRGEPRQPIGQPAGAGAATAMKAVKIAESLECLADVKAHCKGSSASNNFAVLDCLQNDIEDNADISKACQHFVWTYKKNLTMDIRFDSAAHDVCQSDLKNLSHCNSLNRGKGLVIPCLIEAKENVTQLSCKQFLNKMATLIFSDYRLVSMFTEGCEDDILQLNCGRLPDNEDGSPHTQGNTVECLSESVDKLSQQCKLQILRIAELQADDYHLDRPLYYACRLDRERFCEHVQAGSGKVYKCLFKHKFEADMSSECRSMIVVRQRLQSEDVKVNKGLFDSCRVDIRKHHCLRNVENPDGRIYRLSTVLLCLEGVQRDGEHDINPKCTAELKDARRSLMEDYQINPEVVSGCANEIAEHCKTLETGGKTMHCLMELAQHQFKAEGEGKGPRISPNCKAQLEFVLKEADVAEDAFMDPYLINACQTVIDRSCAHHKEEDVMTCLMEKIGSEDMTDDCEETIMETQYFLSRDFKLSDSRLYKYCKKEARTLCKAPEKWYDPESTEPEEGPLTFMCLYRHLNPDEDDIDEDGLALTALSRPCAFEVLRVMRQRSISVELEPRIEMPCLTDLGRFCSEKMEKGKEMQCLQDNYDELSDDCQDAVEKFTEDEDRYIDMDRLLMKACTPMIKQFCGSLIEDNNSPPEAVMECLIKHNMNDKMDPKCAAGIHHHQLTSLKDYRFSYKFKEACKGDVLIVCKGEKIKKKADVVKCLSESVRNATLLDEKQKVSSKCRQQLNFELLQRAESIDLDPELHAACSQNIQLHCSNVSPGKAAIIECLKKHTQDLDLQCKKQIFKREELEALDARIDFALVSACKEMIKTYCHESDTGELFPCLRRHKEEHDFDVRCKRIIVERQRIRATDVHLNPKLKRACDLDINKFCKEEVKEFEGKANVFEGKILMCLRKQFVNDKQRLSDQCAAHMEVRIAESAKDFQQDTRLALGCKQEITKLCADSLAANRADPDGGHVEECLLKKLHERKITRMECKQEILRITQESKADVHVDPLLYRACALNIKSFCGDIPRGQGRQMSCLLSARDNKKFRLEPECKRMLDDRVQLWEYAAKAAPIEGVADMMYQVADSPERSYLLLVLFAMVGVLFVAGLFCGRVTKRVSTQVKNK